AGVARDQPVDRVAAARGRASAAGAGSGAAHARPARRGAAGRGAGGLRGRAQAARRGTGRGSVGRAAGGAPGDPARRRRPMPRPAPAGARLPTQLTPFVGRDRELARLTELSTSGSARLVTITGPGGTGKTRLALEYAAAATTGGSVAEAAFADLSLVDDPAMA